VGRGLPVELAVPVLEQGLVRGLVEAAAADVLLAVGPPEPQLVLDDGPAQLRPVIVDLVDVVRGVAAMEPWKALVPRLVTKLIPSPPVWTLMSLPPVFTAISSKESKSQ